MRGCGPEMLTAFAPGPADPRLPPPGFPYPTDPRQSSVEECHGPRLGRSPLSQEGGLVIPKLEGPQHLCLPPFLP